MKWARNAMRDRRYLVTDKGPQQQQGMKEVGKTDDPTCICDGWTPQNAAHLFQCPSVEDGIGRSWEQAHKNETCGAAVARLLYSRGQG